LLIREDAARLGEVADELAGGRLVAAVVGVDGHEAVPEAAHHVLAGGLDGAGLEAEHVQGPRDRVGEGHQRFGPGAAHAGQVARRGRGRSGRAI
jgi:hypothetical protein